MPEELDIEQPEALLRYLRETGRIGAQETPVITVLRGGVSNRTVRVERAPNQAMVLKQALAKLRVQEDWFSDPARIHREALGLSWLSRLAPPGAITPLLFEDPAQHLLAMQAVPHPHQNWKARLLTKPIERELVEQFGRLLGTIHRNAATQAATLAPVFEDRTFFETLRLEPYYRHAASRNPAAADFLQQLIAETLAQRLTLVHGDYSPKNILVFQHRLILLDHEVIHWGDPAFDLGFSLTHLLSKAFHLKSRRADFLAAAQCYWDAYGQAARGRVGGPGFSQRIVRHTLGCLLARVDGRSPLEYLTPAERAGQRATSLQLMRTPPPTVPELLAAYGQLLNG